MYRDYHVIDADCHVLEPTDLWSKRLPPPYRDHFSDELFVDGRTVYSDKLVDEALHPSPPPALRDYFSYGITAYDPASQVKALRALGADVAFLYPSLGWWLFAIEDMDAQMAGACIRVYNDWLHEFCDYDSGLLRGVGVLNRHAPAEMVGELRRIAAFGWKAVALRPNPVKGRLLSDPEYEPFWSECERLDIAVGIHEGSYSRLETACESRFDTHFALHATSHPMEQMAAFLTLVEGGVLARHPRLRIAFLEAGAGWLPYWLWRLDHGYTHASRTMKMTVTALPSEYFRRQCFIAIDPSEPYLPEIIDYIGSDRVIVGSDFPHYDHDAHVIEDAVGLEQRLSKDTVRKLLWDNPARFYGI